MTTIGVLGATSQIAGDFIVAAADAGYELFLYSRRPEEVSAWISRASLIRARSVKYTDFLNDAHDVVINFVGVGDPARAISMQTSIFDITAQYDTLAIEYLHRRPQTRYIFLSSGAVYGTTFLKPANQETIAQFQINQLDHQEFYSLAKLAAEARHRSLPEFAILDVRIFNYFSRTANLSSRFFITDILRAIQQNIEFETNQSTMKRDFLGPSDFFSLIDCLIRSKTANSPVDAYSAAPVDKFDLLDAMHKEFGLRYRISSHASVVRSTGAKQNYYSDFRKAAEFGYQPKFTSLDCVLKESRAILAEAR